MSQDAAHFDPNSVGLKTNNIFGLPFSIDESALVLLPVPWEVTVSYRNGTARGPENIFKESLQIDLYDADLPDTWKNGYYMLAEDKNIRKKSNYLRQCAELIITCLSDGGDVTCNQQLAGKLQEVNEGTTMMRDWVQEMTGTLLRQGKLVGLVGGDHSTPLGLIRAIGEQYPSFGILQIDAHADLRNAYEGFKYSHASIMYNVLQEVPQMSKLVQVGIRDYCDEELDVIKSQPDRIHTFFDSAIKERQYMGDTWHHICQDIVAALPQHIYISFDIDGLDPKLCPDTGTPVPGGFEMEQVFYLFKTIHNSGKKIIGFDLNEVSCGEHTTDGIDAIVGARVLYKMCNYLTASKDR
ncbi:MAG: agmatinase family protein [Chitinophagaceae bacterium]|nr:agmatinase family protein [Chitinophagaceae bacterium]